MKWFYTKFPVIGCRNIRVIIANQLLIKKKGPFSLDFEEISLNKSVSSGWPSSTDGQPDETAVYLMNTFFLCLITPSRPHYLWMMIK